LRLNMFELIKKESKARRGRLETVHGTIETPAFMNVATCAAIKGGLSSYDLSQIKCSVELCNTYHLHLRPGDDVVREMGGLQKFMGWGGPVITDSGGFQVFSLAKLRRITEEGVHFASHIDGSRIFMGPEESMRIQSNLGSTIAMAFDECVANPATREYTEVSCARTVRWLHRCREELNRLNARSDTLNKSQMLFGINQGATFEDIRIENMQEISALGLDGYAIGGLAVGESAQEMYRIIECIEPFMPMEKPRYLMGVGKPINILEAVERGIDMFDCVMPTRNARHGHVFTKAGIRNLFNARYERDPLPLDEECQCPVCRRYSRAYIHHLFKAKEILALRLCVMHNLYFYNSLMDEIRAAIDGGSFNELKAKLSETIDKRI
jgi:queuine tRNA-ribosyltransferase